MKLTCSKSKNSCTYYVQKSVRIGDRTTTKPVERLAALKRSNPDAVIRILLNGLGNIQKNLLLLKKKPRKAFS